MLSEHIFFIIQSISDILNIDNERNQILPLCQDLSQDERKAFLELHSNDKKRQILESNSDDEIRKISELYPDYEKKEILKWYLVREYESKRIQNLKSLGGRTKKLLILYLPSDLQMYRELSDDCKLEFLHNYTDCWRNGLLKYLEFRRNHSAGTLFEIITLLMQGKEAVLSKYVKEGILELQERLRLIYNYVRDVEAKHDDGQVMSEYDRQFYLRHSHIAHSSDDILDGIMSNDVAHQIHTLLQTIHNFYTSNPSSTGTTYLSLNMKLVAKNNINIGGHQSLANMKLSINHSTPLKDKQNSRPKSYGHVRNSDLVGFNDEIETLRNHLLHDETKVVGIVGPGGAGKTTLAKHIYHHPEISSHFACKVWVCISQSWDKTTILNSIWRQAKQNPKAPKRGYDRLVQRLYKLLSSKSYLVIVDDIWSVNAWYDISPALPSCSGSKVVVTTRNKCLPQHIDPGVLIVEPRQLNDEECYKLFKNRALLDENVHHELLPLGMEMVKKCKGLPLAVVALAGVLGIDKSLSSWERIKKTVTHKMLNMENESTQGVVKEILALSYYELDENLKQCALYLGVFPEDYVIEAQQLIQMWIAEGFIGEENEAEDYLDKIAQRYIVEVVKTNYRGQVLQIRIHDLIRETLIKIDKERDILKNPVLRLAPSATVFWDGQKNFYSPIEILDRNCYETSHARSLLFPNFRLDHHLELQQWFIKLKLLRVLIIDDVLEMELPEEIGNLIHLRYLELSGRTKHLPWSIGNLENLLTLHLDNLEVYKQRKTINLEKLKELRYLYMPWKDKSQLLKGVEKLKKLKTLWGVEVGEWMVSMMPKLSHVLQELCIRYIKEEKEVEAVFRTPSITSNNLHTLELSWHCEVGDMRMMRKCKSITKLELDGKIKKGIRLIFPPSLIHLVMSDTQVEEKEWLNIISDSCPRLKFLDLYLFAYTGKVLVCNKNSFPQLEKLLFAIPSSLKSWIIERGAMPRLNHLDIIIPIHRPCQRLEVNDEARELISKLAPSFIPKLHFPPGSKKRKTDGSLS